MSATYYTPEPEEICLDFVFEAKNPNPYIPSYLYKEGEEWKKTSFQRGDIIQPSYKNSNIRVKHLDREDIEGEGWGYDNNEEPIPPLRNAPYEMPIAFCYEEGLNQYLLYKYKDGLIAIEHVFDCSGEGYIFKGFILNLSEFRKLMKQLNIKKP